MTKSEADHGQLPRMVTLRPRDDFRFGRVLAPSKGKQDGHAWPEPDRLVVVMDEKVAETTSVPSATISNG